MQCLILWYCLRSSLLPCRPELWPFLKVIVCSKRSSQQEALCVTLLPCASIWPVASTNRAVCSIAPGLNLRLFFFVFPFLLAWAIMCKPAQHGASAHFIFQMANKVRWKDCLLTNQVSARCHYHLTRLLALSSCAPSCLFLSLFLPVKSLCSVFLNTKRHCFPLDIKLRLFSALMQP